MERTSVQQNTAVFDYCSHFVLQFAECVANFCVHKLNRDACGAISLLSRTLKNTFILVINIIIYYVEIKRQLDATDDFYCRSYCLLNTFRAPLCPSSGAREYYTSGCCLSYLMLGFQVVGMVLCWGLCFWSAGFCAQ